MSIVYIVQVENDSWFCPVDPNYESTGANYCKVGILDSTVVKNARCELIVWDMLIREWRSGNL